MINEKRRCYNCRFFETHDYGYSNYTVTETVVDCLKDKNKAFPCKESYSWIPEQSTTADHPIVSFAEKCDSYDYNGYGVHFDVDGEITIDDYKKDETVYNLLLIKYGNKEKTND